MTIESAAVGSAGEALGPDRRRQIVDAAARLLVGMSPDKVGIRDLERESGITRGGIYYYFSSKEEIFSEVVLVGLSLLRDDLIEAAAGDDGAERKMRRILAIFGRHYDDYRSMFDVLIRFFFGAEPAVRIDAALQQSVDELISSNLRTVIGVIEEGRAEGVFHCTDPMFEAMAIWGIMVTVIQMQTPSTRLAMVARDPERLNADLVEYVLKSLRA